jgi:hypothetical protein
MEESLRKERIVFDVEVSDIGDDVHVLDTDDFDIPDEDEET